MLSLLFSYRGGIGRAQYLTAALIAASCAVGALVFLAVASNPKGSGDGALLLGFPLLILFLWIFTAAVTKRLRDAKWPVALKALYALAPIPMFFVIAQMNSGFEIAIVAGLAAMALVPALAGPSNQSVQAES